MSERARARRCEAVARERDLSEADEPRYLADLARLEQVLEETLTRSVLPEEPTNREEIEEFTVEARLLI